MKGKINLKSSDSQKSISEHEIASRPAQPVRLYHHREHTNEQIEQNYSSTHQTFLIRDLATADATAARHIQFQIMKNFNSMNNAELQELRLIVSKNLASKQTLSNKGGYILTKFYRHRPNINALVSAYITLKGINFELFENSL